MFTRGLVYGDFMGWGLSIIAVHASVVSTNFYLSWNYGCIFFLGKPCLWDGYPKDCLFSKFDKIVKTYFQIN